MREANGSAESKDPYPFPRRERRLEAAIRSTLEQRPSPRRHSVQRHDKRFIPVGEGRQLL